MAEVEPMAFVRAQSPLVRAFAFLTALAVLAGCQPATNTSNSGIRGPSPASSSSARQGRATKSAPAPTISGIALNDVAVKVSANLGAVNGYLSWYLGNGKSGGWPQLDKAAAIRSGLGLNRNADGLPVRIQADLMNAQDMDDRQADVAYRITVRYSVTDMSGVSILDEMIVSEGTATFGDAFLGSTRVRIGGKRAFEANVRQFRSLLAEKLPQRLASYLRRGRRAATTASDNTSADRASANRLATAGAETGTGFYALEEDLNFNVLDEVAFDAASEKLTLIGHFDLDRLGPRIPYLQHLAVLLENPEPEFSLDWTPESARAMDAFLNGLNNRRNMMSSLNLKNPWFNPDGSINEHGKRMVKMFGFEPVDGGRRPGRLGVTIRAPRTQNESAVIVTGVSPGGPADRAGIRPGDELMTVNKVQPRHLAALSRIVRKAGAGKTIAVQINRPARLLNVNVTLGQGSDPWRGFNRVEMVADILRRDGNNQGANIIERVEEWQLTGEGPKAQSALISLYLATGIAIDGFAAASKRMNRKIGNVRSGRWSERRGMESMLRDIFRGTEIGLRLPAGSVVGAFDRAIASGRHPTRGYDIAVREIDRQLRPVFMKSLRRALRRQSEVVMTVNDVAKETGVTPVVKPTYTGLPAQSHVARVLYQADYLGKSLIMSPRLARHVPGFKTEYAYFADAGGAGKGRGLDRRMWFTIGKLKLAQSGDGGVLAFKDIRMRFNVGPEQGQPSNAERGYADLLTSHYDALSKLLPPLHELREVAKLTAAAKWLRSKKRRLRLPREGRRTWKGPDQVPALVRLVWSPRRSKVSILAPGGVSLFLPDVPPVGPGVPMVPVLDYPVPVDTSIVDLRALERSVPVIPESRIPSNVEVIDMDRVSAPASWLGVPSFEFLPRKRITRTVPPVPLPHGFKALATRGATLAKTLSLRLADAGRSCGDMNLQDINDEATEVSRLMAELEHTERIMNAITEKNLDRKAAEAELARYVGEVKENLETAAIDLATRGMLETYQINKVRAQLHGLDELRQGIDFALDVHGRVEEESKTWKSLYTRARIAYQTATADDLESRKRVMGELVDLMGDLIEEAEDMPGKSPSAKIMRVAGKVIKKAKRYAKLAKTGADVLRIAAALQKRLAFDGDQAAAKELHRHYKRRVDALNDAMSTPAIKALMAGSLCRIGG